jgi:hypothetical protein
VKLLVMLLLAAFCGGGDAQDSRSSISPVRFLAVDIYVDPQEQPLAAYQLVFHVDRGVARIVGIEGGAHPAFAEAPFYDPAAIQHEHVILAAFNTGAGSTLPTRKTRVATVHLETPGGRPLRYRLKVETAATVGGTQIKTIATYKERKPE